MLNSKTKAILGKILHKSFNILLQSTIIKFACFCISTREMSGFQNNAYWMDNNEISEIVTDVVKKSRSTVEELRTNSVNLKAYLQTKPTLENSRKHKST